MGKDKIKTRLVEEAGDEREHELERLISEHAMLSNQIDVLEEMRTKRKGRIHLLMRELGRSKLTADDGTANFQVRRSFQVTDHERLAELMSPGQLAALAKITADVYDAALSENVPLDEAVTVGKDENLTVSRRRTKEAKARRNAHIEESRRQAEARLEALREEFRKAKKKGA